MMDHLPRNGKLSGKAFTATKALQRWWQLLLFGYPLSIPWAGCFSKHFTQQYICSHGRFVSPKMPLVTEEFATRKKGVSGQKVDLFSVYSNLKRCVFLWTPATRLQDWFRKVQATSQYSALSLSCIKFAGNSPTCMSYLLESTQKQCTQ